MGAKIEKHDKLALFLKPSKCRRHAYPRNNCQDFFSLISEKLKRNFTLYHTRVPTLNHHQDPSLSRMKTEPCWSWSWPWVSKSVTSRRILIIRNSSWTTWVEFCIDDWLMIGWITFDSYMQFVVSNMSVFSDKLICMKYCIYSINRHGIYYIFRDSSTTFIRGRRLFKIQFTSYKQ